MLSRCNYGIIKMWILWVVTCENVSYAWIHLLSSKLCLRVLCKGGKGWWDFNTATLFKKQKSIKQQAIRSYSFLLMHMFIGTIRWTWKETILILMSWSYVDRSTTQTHMSMTIFRDNFVQNKGNIHRQASAMNSCSLHLAGCRKFLNPTNKNSPVSF